MKLANENLADSVFLKACRSEKVPHTPIWIMRQAGRYMKEYQDVRSKVSFLELCKNPELASEVTVVAAEKLGVDAAIIFADILLITEPMGFNLEFHEGKGPLIDNPLRTQSDLEKLSAPKPKSDLSFVLEAIKLTRKNLPSHIPLLGFAGAPFTVASYVIEGKSSRNLENTKKVMRGEPKIWQGLMELISTATTKYLLAQIEAGAQAIQIFDSWIGALNPSEYLEYVLPHMKKIFSAIPQGTPAIHFGTGTGLLLEDMVQAGGSVQGIDFQTPLDQARERLKEMPVQGNLDPTTLLCSIPVIEREARKVLNQGGKQGHIFNLGHGILPMTNVDHAKRLVDFVHEESQR